MTPDEVRTMPDKAIVIAGHTLPKWAPHRVREKWVNDKGTIARLKLVGGKDWVDATAWSLAPAGKTFSTIHGWKETQTK